MLRPLITASAAARLCCELLLMHGQRLLACGILCCCSGCLSTAAWLRRCPLLRSCRLMLLWQSLSRYMLLTLMLLMLLLQGPRALFAQQNFLRQHCLFLIVVIRKDAGTEMLRRLRLPGQRMLLLRLPGRLLKRLRRRAVLGCGAVQLMACHLLRCELLLLVHVLLALTALLLRRSHGQACLLSMLIRRRTAWMLHMLVLRHAAQRCAGLLGNAEVQECCRRPLHAKAPQNAFIPGMLLWNRCACRCMLVGLHLRRRLRQLQRMLGSVPCRLRLLTGARCWPHISWSLILSSHQRLAGKHALQAPRCGIAMLLGWLCSLLRWRIPLPCSLAAPPQPAKHPCCALLYWRPLLRCRQSRVLCGRGMRPACKRADCSLPSCEHIAKAFLQVNQLE